MEKKIRVTVWNEFRHEVTQEKVKAVYPEGIHKAIGEGLLASGGFEVRYAWLDQDAEHGLGEELLVATDVLVWWGHCAHGKVKDEIVDRVQKHIQQGMGLIRAAFRTFLQDFQADARHYLQPQMARSRGKGTDLDR